MMSIENLDEDGDGDLDAQDTTATSSSWYGRTTKA